MYIPYPVRCRIVDATGHKIGQNSPLMARTPASSLPHIGKEGLAEEITDAEGTEVRITLDDGTVLNGSECWWIPLGTANRIEHLVRLLFPEGLADLRKIVEKNERFNKRPNLMESSKVNFIGFAIEARAYSVTEHGISFHVTTPYEPETEDDPTNFFTFKIPLERVKEYLAEIDQSEV